MTEDEYKQLSEQIANLTATLNRLGFLPGSGRKEGGLWGRFVRGAASTLGEWGITSIALALAALSLWWFGLYPFPFGANPFDPKDSWYLTGCCLLYMLWTIGVPTWFALDFIFIYDKKTPPLEEYKVNMDLDKSAWISVAVVLAAIFAIRTHFDFSKPVPETPDKVPPGQTAPADTKTTNIRNLGK
jgi:hypothetical protein